MLLTSFQVQIVEQHCIKGFEFSVQITIENDVQFLCSIYR
jgi:hypothetical protein